MASISKDEHSETNMNRHVNTTNPANEPKPSPSLVPGPPPHGGLLAWTQVAASFFVFLNTWGMVSSFAVFQTYYESGELFQASSSDISWIGSLQGFLLQVTGLIAGPLYDRGYLRYLLVIGSFMVVFGHMMLSLCKEFWQVLLAQGFCVGIGAGLMFIPTVSLLPAWFSSHMALAVGIAASGSSLGGVIYPIMLDRLFNEIGFPWAVRTIAFFMLGTFSIPLLAMRMRFRVPKPRAIIDWSALRDLPFMVFTIALLIAFVGQTVLLFYISFCPQNKGFTNTSLAFYITAIFNAGSTIGRILPPALADRIGVFNTMAPLIMLLGTTILCLLAVHSAAEAILGALFSGLFSGVVVALPPVCFRMLTENKAMIGTRVGQGFALAGVGILIAGPSGGAILERSQPLNWTGLWTYSGVTVLCAGLILVALRIMRSGFTFVAKV